ncbi:MAG: FkbM family methyltransferase [Sphingobacteriales bacterium]|nr:MAG: FkbM family methyltransferase [Sphingobacteriales bacterium]
MRMRLFNTGYTFQEKLSIFLLKVINRIILRLNKNGLLANYISEINQLKKSGFQCERSKQNVLQISKNELNYVLRPYTSDYRVFNQVYIDEEYKPLLEIIKQLNFNKPLKIIDAGSNIGLFSHWISQNVEIDRVVSIEADTENFHFQKIYYSAKYKTILKLALWGYSNKKLTLGSSFRGGEHWAKSIVQGDKEKGNEVNSITLNDIYKQYFENEEIDILKIDVEGAEANIFAETNSYDVILKKTKILALEIHDEFKCRENIYNLLTNNGFTILDIGETTFAYKK